MTSAERKIIPRVIEEETNQELWEEVRKKVAFFFSSVAYSSLTKRGETETDVGIALNFGDEERVFKVIQQQARCGKITLELCDEDLPGEHLAVIFESKEPFHFKLLEVRLVKEEAQDENSFGA